MGADQDGYSEAAAKSGHFTRFVDSRAFGARLFRSDRLSVKHMESTMKITTRKAVHVWFVCLERSSCRVNGVLLWGLGSALVPGIGLYRIHVVRLPRR
jgi:hypothetical protein